MKLTDNEIRDITKHLEAGKSLPDKYRFLLFEDKREVELVWNGKTNDICNIVLPFQTIEQVDEPHAVRKTEDTSAQFGLFDDRGRQLRRAGVAMDRSGLTLWPLVDQLISEGFRQ